MIFPLYTEVNKEISGIFSFNLCIENNIAICKLCETFKYCILVTNGNLILS